MSTATARSTGRTREHAPEFDTVFDALLTRAWTLAEAIVGDPILAEEIAIEALARMCVDWKRVADHRPDLVLARHVVQLSIDAVARREPLEVTTAATAVPAPGGALLHYDEASALKALPRRRREVVGLWFFAQLGKRDIATLLKVKPKIVDAELALAREALAESLGVDVMDAPS
jgi:DNA-directed RNA polymerase specialized sigma24 family protein